MNKRILALIIAGCSSSESGDASVPVDGGGSRADARATGGDAGGHSSLTWKYDGVMHTANSTTAIRRRDATFDFLEVVASQSTGDGIGFTVSDLSPADSVMITGAHDCPGTNVISVSLVYNVTGSDSPMSCTVVLTQPGMQGTQNAVGTFEAILSNGKAITEGKFDIPIGTAIHL